jgi:hypothetical protein
MRGERGSVVVYLLFSIVASIGFGYVVYRSIRDARLARAASAELARASAPAPTRTAVAPSPAAPAPLAPAHEPAPEPAVPAEPVAPTPASLPDESDEADHNAVDPPSFEDSAVDNVVFGRPGVAGGGDRFQIEKVVKRYSVRLVRCVRKARENGPVTRGSMRFEFVIDADGVVGTATYRGGDVAPMVGDCMLQTLTKLRFDKPADGHQMKVVYPIAFAPAVIAGSESP